ncbi:hypothetical protein THAOC_01129 [Thalassiosira oceanica]|uniref:Uncharacterized protein n=1 Tax=Thalassiosira oceanica TaxID=159749 RepID=K0TR26_THAOC|nr:hypothetical protein THAOC_01129 [Thalassiosira oceanica]|eukprot:EJK77062.1 hypothetical protein THAOC_01129 [Thalassiosira oceanica]
MPRARVLAMSVCANIALAHGATQHVRRKLEDSGFSGEWDGSWEAASNDDVAYDCDGDSCNDGGTTRSGWNDDGLELQMSENEIITAVSVGIAAFMALLCCFCYPEILVLSCNKLCCCCCPRRDPASGEGQVYIGGKQSDKRRRRSKTSRSRSSGKRASSSSKQKDVELV